MILDKITKNSDIKKLNTDELVCLSNELREKIISVTKKNGGHLSSNLGIVETTVALHYVFDFKSDKLIFDVGHQCYAHKILSDRKDKFDTIRLDGGLSGFPNHNESAFDTFTTGHSGTSIGSSLGLSVARDMRGESYSVVDIVGDGSIVNGLNLEAITSNAEKPKNMLVILNDNGMSISKNGNALYHQLSKGFTNVNYYKGKNLVKRVLGESKFAGFLSKIKDGIKGLLIRNNFFEKFGFKYMFVRNGNDLKTVLRAVKKAKQIMKYKAVLLHVRTTKGKGLKQAEEHSDAYHGVGKELSTVQGAYATALGNRLNELIGMDEKIVVITAGMKDGTGLNIVEKTYPKNFIDVGIAEEYAVTLSAGLSKGGLKPVVAIYSTFLQRGFDEVLHDVCLQNLPVIFCLDRAGLSGADGVTHQGTFDLSYLSCLPNMTVLSPANVEEFRSAIDYALSLASPVAIRYPRDDEYKFISKENDYRKWEKVSPTVNGEKISILCVGPRMIRLGKEIEQELDGACVYNVRTVKPLDENTLDAIKENTVITLEENNVIGGFGSQVSLYYSKKGYKTRLLPFGIDDKFINHGSIGIQLDGCGLNKDAILNKIKSIGKGKYE